MALRVDSNYDQAKVPPYNRSDPTSPLGSWNFKPLCFQARRSAFLRSFAPFCALCALALVYALLRSFQFCVLLRPTAFRTTAFGNCTECTKPSHSQSLANFVANFHSQGISPARTNFSQFHSQNHSHLPANAFATLSSQLLLWDLDENSLANFSLRIFSGYF